jgi:hypothetical protein
MKKLKGRLTRKITDILSALVLWCDGKGCFKVSSQYRFQVSDIFFLGITKDMGTVFSYHFILENRWVVILETTLRYNIFRKDVPIQRAYTTKGTRIDGGIDNITGLKKLLGELNEEIRKKS